MIITELPKSLSEKTFIDVKEFMEFIHDEGILTEYGELAESEITQGMITDLQNAKKMETTDFVNI